MDIKIVKFEDLGLHNCKFKSLFILSDGREILSDFAFPAEPKKRVRLPAYRILADRTALLNAGVSEETVDSLLTFPFLF